MSVKKSGKVQSKRNTINKKIKFKDKKGLYICLIGMLCIFAWGILLFQLLYGYFFDKSSVLGLDDDYGVIVIAHNLYGEMLFEFFLFSGVFLGSIYMFYYILKRY